MSKPRLFIDYSAKDMKIAEQLHKKLEAAGFEIWRDQTQLEVCWTSEVVLVPIKNAS